MTGRGDETDEDRLWRSIVENYGERASLDEGARPTSEVSESEPDSAAEPTPVPAPAPAPAPVEEPIPQTAWVQRHLAEEHFVPPVPPPSPAPEPARLIAWAGVLGVPVLLIVLVVARFVLPAWGSLLMLVWFLGGFGYLVATMRRDPGQDDDWDDGAVV